MHGMPPGAVTSALERELRRIPGVMRVRVVTDDSGSITEVHTVSLPGKLAKQIVRDIQSVAMATFGISIDRRVISVVQLDHDPGRPDEGGGTEEIDLTDGPALDVAAPAGPASGGALVDPEADRIRLDDVVVVRGELQCRVTVSLRRGDQRVEGTSEGLAGERSVLRLTAMATLSALAQVEPAAASSDIESADVVRHGDRELAVTNVVLVTGGGEDVVTGAVPVREAGRFDAVARAVLDATNRRLRRLV